MQDSNHQKKSAPCVYAALLTPRRPNSIEADGAALLDYLDLSTAAGVNGIVLFGATGEFVHFEVSERMHVAALAIKRSRVPVLVNASHSSLAGAVEIGENAVVSGASGLLLTPPYFYSYGDDQIFAFYQKFVEAIGAEVPVYLYNLPTFVNPIQASLAARLLEGGVIAGIKDSSGDLEMLRSLHALRQKTSFTLFLGNETLYTEARELGVDGVISGLAAAVPELIVALQRTAGDSDPARGQQLIVRLNEFLAYVNKFASTVVIRQAAVARGWPLSHAAIPFDEDTAAEIIRFHAWFREWWPQVLRECAEPAAMRT